MLFIETTKIQRVQMKPEHQTIMDYVISHLPAFCASVGASYGMARTAYKKAVQKAESLCTYPKCGLDAQRTAETGVKVKVVKQNG